MDAGFDALGDAAAMACTGGGDTGGERRSEMVSKRGNEVDLRQRMAFRRPLMCAMESLQSIQLDGTGLGDLEP